MPDNRRTSCDSMKRLQNGMRKRPSTRRRFLDVNQGSSLINLDKRQNNAKMTKPACRTCLETGIKYGTNDSTAEISVKSLFLTMKSLIAFVIILCMHIYSVHCGTYQVKKS